MHSTLESFSKINIDDSFLDEVWAFSPRDLGSLDDLRVSMYSTALAQFLIFFKYEQNKTKAEIAKQKKLLDSTISVSLTKEIIKEYKTKTAAAEYMVCNNPQLAKLEQDMDDAKMELIRLDGIDKAVSEYIATFKRELTRRENELYAIRAERK